MKSKNLITLGIGAVGGFLCGSVFVVGKILKSIANKYGWDAETVMDMKIVKTKYGYKIDIPPAERLPE